MGSEPAQAEPARRLREYGAAGKLDASGTVVGASMDYDLNLKLRDGSLSPELNLSPDRRLSPDHSTSPDREIAALDATATMHLTPRRLEVLDLAARRGAGALSARGWIDWSTGKQIVSLGAEAKNLTLDRGLYNLISKEPRLSWDFLHPVGDTDANLSFDNRPPPDTG